MWSRRWGFVVSWLSVLGACGGNLGRHERDVPASSGASGEPSTVAPPPAGTGGVAAGGTGGATAGETPLSLLGCPTAEWFGECSEPLRLELDFREGAQARSGTWAEPIQLASFENTEMPGPNLPPPKDRADWDRSEVPENACVFRLHGVQVGCLGRFNSMFYGGCDGERVVSPLGYYELDLCAEGVAPGCDSDNPWVTNGEQGWYFRPTSEGEIHLIACAASCQWMLGQRACIYGAGP